jgi:pyruvate dehydrogenase E2 component (dihydrolipoamide acetyltransferase)
MVKFDQYNTPWRLMSTAIYSAPKDSKVYGTLEVDVTDAEKYIKEQRHEGNKITMTHLVTAALARSLAFNAPEVNCFVRRGKIIPRAYFDVAVSVNIRRGREMSAVIVKDAHLLTVSQIAKEIRAKAASSRTGIEEKSMKNKYLLSKIPWPFRNWIYNLVKWIVNDVGINLKSAGLSDDAFGSIMLSNIGTHGLSTGMPALFPAGKLPAVVVMGKTEIKPTVINGDVVARSILPLTGTFDHRIMDGGQIGKLARGVARRLAKPEELDIIEKSENA